MSGGFGDEGSCFFVTPYDTPVEVRPTAQYRLISDPVTTESQDRREKFAAR